MPIAWSNEEAEQVKTRLIVLFEGFGVPVIPEKFQAYLEGLSDLSPEQIEAACLRAVRECDWLPKVKALRDFAPTRASLSIKNKPEDACPDCGGTGFKIIEKPRSDGSVWRLADKCGCRSRKTA